MWPPSACSSRTPRTPSRAGSHGTKRRACGDCASDPAAGASPLFFPSGRTPRQARAELVEVLRHAPRRDGLPFARWTLTLLMVSVLWLAPLTPSGVHRLLLRLRLVYRRGQMHVHSPDPEYDAKLVAVRRARAEAQASGGRVVLVYLDEVSYYRRPSVGTAYAPVGGPGPSAEQGHRTNTRRRIVGAMNA